MQYVYTLRVLHECSNYEWRRHTHTTAAAKYQLCTAAYLEIKYVKNLRASHECDNHKGNVKRSPRLSFPSSNMPSSLLLLNVVLALLVLLVSSLLEFSYHSSVPPNANSSKTNRRCPPSLGNVSSTLSQPLLTLQSHPANSITPNNLEMARNSPETAHGDSETTVNHTV